MLIIKFNYIQISQITKKQFILSLIVSLRYIAQQTLPVWL